MTCINYQIHGKIEAITFLYPYQFVSKRGTRREEIATKSISPDIEVIEYNYCLFLFVLFCMLFFAFVYTYIHIYFDDITLYMNTRFFICIISLSQIIPLFNFCIRSFHRRKYELSLISGDYLVNDLTTDFCRYLYVMKCMVIDV